MMHRSNKFRGRRTHGRGRKGGRGAGKRGGKGNAGLHKHRYLTTVTVMPNHFGRHGFKRPQSVVSSNEVMNLCRINECLDRWVAEGKATQEKGKYILDATALGVDKLLGGGSISKPLVIKVSRASSRAIEKVEVAGGSVELSG